MKKSILDLYDPEFVKGMFDRMSRTYGLANLITSFGFTALWRHQCIKNLPPVKDNAHGYDLMSGMGEAWTAIQKKIGPHGKILAIDISDEMNRKAASNLRESEYKNIEVIQANILSNNLSSESADFIVSTFGVKTFNDRQQQHLAFEIARILKPEGVFALIEISEPENLLLKWPYMFYLKLIIPLVGKVFLGNSEDYRMLGKYCAAFKSCKKLNQFLQQQGLESNFKKYFFGCATGVYGKRKD